ncbi:hypothetical protein [Aquabacterium sp.]|uniref:hypothetical protein n=1 Tax=Aquabacterium sp. TaxID=1872578 RepID=UPI0027B900C8|nr:hypothetical protein [Aquabacterium sp.]
MDTLLLEGSEVRAMRWEARDVPGGSTVCVEFAAACVRRDPVDAPGGASVRRDSVWGNVTALTLRLSGVMSAPDVGASEFSLDGTLGEAIGTLSGGEVRQAAQMWRALPLPCHVSGPVTLSLRFRAGQEWVWQGHELTVQAEAGSRFFESYAC